MTFLSSRRFGDHGFKLDAAVRGCDPDQPIILLAHQPKAAKIALDSDHDIQLVLSGSLSTGFILYSFGECKLLFRDDHLTLY